MWRWWHRFVDWFGTSDIGSWLYGRVGPPIDRFLLKKTRGRFSMAIGKPIALLKTTGARSGLSRETPVLYGMDGERVILIASNFGSASHPAWYHNLMKNPNATLIYGGRIRDFRAHTATGEEREHLWQKALALYSGFEVYKERADHREIPVVVLTPQ